MKTTHLSKATLALMLSCLTATPCDAQFNKIIKKAKSAVEKVQKQAPAERHDVKTAPATVLEPKTMPSKRLDDDTIYKPSAEAIAADPQATNETVDNGYTRTIGQIHASYEHLDPKMFPYQPYYKYKKFYFMDDSATDMDLMGHFGYLLERVLTLPDLMKFNVPYEDFVMEDGTKAVVPIDETWRHAYVARYLADPTSTMSFKSYSWVLLFQKQLLGNVGHYIEDSQNGIVNAKEGLMLPWRNLFEMRYERENKALELACTVTNVKEITELADSWFNSAEKATKAYDKLWYYNMGAAIFDFVVAKHDHYNADDPLVRQVKMKYNKQKEMRLEWQEECIAKNSPGQPLPEGVSVSAEIKSKGTAAAKAYAGANFLKVVFLKSNWETFKEQKWPYRITAYRIPIVVVTKEHGKLMQQPCDLQKSPSGNTYNVVAGMNGAKIPVAE